MAAAKNPDVCGLLLVAASGRHMGEIIREQLKANPANAPLLSQALPAIDALEAGKHVDTAVMHPALLRLFRPEVQEFLISAFCYDPPKLLAGYGRPVLILQGQRDLQVREADARALKLADPTATLVLLPIPVSNLAASRAAIPERIAAPARKCPAAVAYAQNTWLGGSHGCTRSAVGFR